MFVMVLASVSVPVYLVLLNILSVFRSIVSGNDTCKPWVLVDKLILISWILQYPPVLSKAKSGLSWLLSLLRVITPFLLACELPSSFTSPASMHEAIHMLASVTGSFFIVAACKGLSLFLNINSHN